MDLCRKNQIMFRVASIYRNFFGMLHVIKVTNMCVEFLFPLIHAVLLFVLIVDEIII
jgi:hypothetical protein